MGTFDENHPCHGKDCLQCETCIFDRDLFEGEITPNERLRQANTKKINNMCSNRLCNDCVNLKRNYEHCETGHFDASCKVVSYSAFGNTRPRRIDYNLAPNQSIVSPTWCPLKDSAAQLMLPSPSSSRPKPQETGPQPNTSTSTPIYTSYSDRREKMKELKKHIEWDDIKEGNIYVIPKILNQARKIVKVITKTNMSCICHEISDITGNEFTYNCTVYPSDLDTVFITELRKF